MHAFQSAKRRRPSQQYSNLRVLLLTFLIVVGIGLILYFVSMRLSGDKSKDKAADSAPTQTEGRDNAVNDEDATIVTEQREVESSEESDVAPPDDESEADSGEVDTRDDDENTEEPIEIVRPEVDQMKTFLPEGSVFNRYWWNNMNEDDYDEVLVGYTKDGEVHLMNLGVKDETVGYEVTWDQTLFAGQLVDLSSHRVSDGYLVKAQTSAANGGRLDLYKYGDDEVSTYPIVGGRLDGETTEVVYAANLDKRQTTPAQVSYANGELIVDYYAEKQADDFPEGDISYDRESYTYHAGEFVFRNTKVYVVKTGVSDSE